MKQRPEYDPKIIGMNLRRLREEKHLTVEQVREYLCLGSVQAIYKYETGVGYPQADTMLALMELYEAGVNEIVKLNSEEHSSSVSIFAPRSDGFSGQPQWRKDLSVIILAHINPSGSIRMMSRAETSQLAETSRDIIPRL